MPITISCAACGKQYTVPDQQAGKRGKCRACGADLVAPPRAELAAPTGLSTPAVSRRKASSSRAPLVAGIVLVLLLLAAVAGGGAWWYFTPGSPLGDGSRYLPSNTRLLLSVRVDALTVSDAWRELEAELPQRLAQFEQDIGLAPADMAQVLVGGSMREREQPLVIIRTRQPVTAADFLKRDEYRGFKEVAIGKYTMYEGTSDLPDRPSPVLCVPESHLVIFGWSDVLRPVLERGKPPEFTVETQALIDTTDFSKPVVFALNLKNLKLTWTAGSVNLGMQQFPGVVGLTAEITATKPYTLLVAVPCETPPRAETTRKKIEATMAASKEEPLGTRDLMAILDGIKWRSDGDRVLGTGQPQAANILKVLFGPGRRTSGSKAKE